MAKDDWPLPPYQQRAEPVGEPPRQHAQEEEALRDGRRIGTRHRQAPRRVDPTSTLLRGCFNGRSHIDMFVPSQHDTQGRQAESQRGARVAGAVLTRRAARSMSSRLRVGAFSDIVGKT